MEKPFFVVGNYTVNLRQIAYIDHSAPDEGTVHMSNGETLQLSNGLVKELIAKVDAERRDIE